MLGQAPGLSHTQSQSSIRHQVRKLRAKVKSLVPIDMCQHYQKRNHRIAKLQKLEDQWKKEREASLNESLWKVTSGFNSSHSQYFSKRQIIEQSNQKQAKQAILKKVGLPQRKFISAQLKNEQQEHPKDSNTFRQPNGNVLQRYEFQKLTHAEIQQINDDKIYYLGQNNIQPYNQFLKKYESELLRKNSQSGFTHKIKYSSSLHNNRREEVNSRKQQTFRKEAVYKEKNHQKKWSSEKNIRASSELVKRNRNSCQMNQNGKNYLNNEPLLQIDEDTTPANTHRKTLRKEFKNLEQRKLFIKQQTDGDIDYHKTRLKERENKSQLVYRQACYSKFFKFKKNSSQASLKIDRALNKKAKMLQDDGDIKNINQILRQKIILKKAEQQKKHDPVLRKTSPDKLQA